MTFKPSIWRPIAIALSVLNFAGIGFAVASAEPWHATVHAGLALAFAWGALRLRQGPGGTDTQDRLELLEGEMSNLGRALGEVQERLDFAERVLAQAQESRRVGPER
jgi:hypothetical protein